MRGSTCYPLHASKNRMFTFVWRTWDMCGNLQPACSMRALPRPGIESMSPALVGSSYPLCYQGDPNPLSYCFVLFLFLFLFLIYRESTAWDTFSYEFWMAQRHIKYLFLPILPFYWHSLPPIKLFMVLYRHHTVFCLSVFPGRCSTPHSPLWLAASCHCASQLNCSHLRKPQFSQSGLETLFFFSLPWAHLHHYS